MDRNRMAGAAVVWACAAGLLAQNQGQNPPQDPAQAAQELVRQFQQRMAELEKRVAELESGTQELGERLGSRANLQAYSAQSVDFGGHLSGLWSYIHGEHGDSAGNYAVLLELYIKAHLAPNWTLFATPGFYTTSTISWIDPNDPTWGRSDSTSPTDFGVLMMRAYSEYEPSDAFHVKLGLIGTPHGVINREYFIPSRITGLTPLMTRLLTDNLLYPQILVGTSISGRISTGGKDALQYDVYVGAETVDPGSPEAGARIGYEFGDSGLVLAADYGHGRRASFTQVTGLPTAFSLPISGQYPWPSYSDVRHSYDFTGIDCDWRKGAWLLQGEAYYSAEQGTQDKIGVYVQPTFYFSPKWAISYRYDYFDPGEHRGYATENVLTLLHDYDKNVRLRLDLHHLELPLSPVAADFVNVSFSTSF